MTSVQLEVPDPDNEVVPRSSLPSTITIAVPSLARALSWSLVGATLYQSTLIIYIVGPFIYIIGMAKKDEIPGMAVISQT